MSAMPLLLDTSGWLLALAGVAPYEDAVGSATRLIVPGFVLGEMDWHLRARRPDMRRLLREVARGAYDYEAPSRADLRRADEIDTKFHDLRLGLVDASIVALAERLDVDRILTADGDFVAVRFGRGWRRALRLVVPLDARP